MKLTFSGGREIRNDFSASMVVFLVALPLCLGIGLASTGNPELVFSGVIAGCVGGLVVGFFSGSPLGVSGPAAGLVTIVFMAIEKLGSFEALLLAVFLAGLLQLIAGFLRGGIIGHYFPSSVIKGMLAAIGLTLMLKQIPHAVGYDPGDAALTEGQRFFPGVALFEAISPAALLITVTSLAMLVLFERPTVRSIPALKFLPGALFVVLTGIVMNLLFTWIRPEWVLGREHLVQLPVAENAAEFIGFFRMPDFSALANPDVYVLAITIALVASLETLLCVEATDKLDPLQRTTPTNRELKAQGIGNMVSGFLGGLPVTQVIVRSSANIHAGARSKVSAICHGFILLMAAYALPSLLNQIPLASLAAILLMVGYKLSTPLLYRNMFRLGYEQFLPFIATVTGILLTDLLRGIAIGVAVAIFFVLRKNYKHSHQYRREKRPQEESITIRLSEEVSFLNKACIRERLEELPINARVVIDASHSHNIDYDVLELIQHFRAYAAPRKNIKVETIGIN